MITSLVTALVVIFVLTIVFTCSKTGFGKAFYGGLVGISSVISIVSIIGLLIVNKKTKAMI